MKKDISYKTLIIGSAVYILCGLVINYLFGVGDVLSEQAIAAGEKIIFSRQEPLSFLSLQFLPIFLRALGLLLMIIPGCRIISISQL